MPFNASLLFLLLPLTFPFASSPEHGVAGADVSPNSSFLVEAAGESLRLPAATTIDDGDAGYVEHRGTFTDGPTTGLGGDSRRSNGGNAYVSWTFPGQSGTVSVEAWWPMDSNGASDAMYLVRVDGTIQSVSIHDQAADGDRWVNLGDFEAGAGATIEVILQRGFGCTRYLLADSIKVDQVAPPVATGSGIVPIFKSATHYSEISYFYFTNQTPDPVRIEVQIRGRSGALLTGDSSYTNPYPANGLSNVTYNQNGMTIAFDLAPGAVGGFQTLFPASLNSEWGESWAKIYWTQQNSSVEEAVTASVIYQSPGGNWAYPINGGNAF